MEVDILDFVEQLGIDIDTVHHAEFMHKEPDTWFYYTHLSGDHKDSWFKRIFKFELPWHKNDTYDKDIIYSSYDNKEYTAEELENKDFFKKYVFDVDNKGYPVWFASGMCIYIKNAYGNPTSGFKKYCVGKYVEDDEIRKIIYEINNKVNYIC